MPTFVNLKSRNKFLNLFYKYTLYIPCLSYKLISYVYNHTKELQAFYTHNSKIYILSDIFIFKGRSQYIENSPIVIAFNVL